MSDIIAVPFDPLPIEKFEKIVTASCQHRPWFDDLVWDDPQTRREAVIAYLSDAHNYGKLFEVWKDQELLGIILFNELVPFRDVRCHFVFYDSKLGDKAQLCLNIMGWAFAQLPVEVLRVEIPGYASALLKFVRRTLGFKFEAEDRDFSWPAKAPRLTADEAKLGSRKYHATQYKGVWHDVMLLSLSADEFRTLGEQRRASIQVSLGPQETRPASPLEPKPNGRSLDKTTEPSLTT